MPTLCLLVAALLAQTPAPSQAATDALQRAADAAQRAAEAAERAAAVLQLASRRTAVHSEGSQGPGRPS